MKIQTSVFALSLSLVAAPAVFADEGDDEDLAPLDVPAALVVPSDQELAFVALGVGVQIYDCRASANGAAWAFRAPEAVLYAREGNDDDEDLKVIGTHSAGPTWQDKRGKVVASVVARVASPDPNAIPWLRLVAASHDGHGKFSRVTSIQRLHTVGGKAPASGCTASTVGAEARVPYRADYYFYELADSDR